MRAIVFCRFLAILAGLLWIQVGVFTGNAQQEPDTSFSWSDDGQILAVGTTNEIQIYRSGPSASLVIPTQHSTELLAFNQDNSLLASADSAGVVNLWDTTTGDLVGTWGYANFGSVTGFYFCPDQEVLAIFFYDAPSLVRGSPLSTGIWFWEYRTTKESHVVSTSPYPGENIMAFNSDRTLVATTSRSSQLGNGLPIATVIVRDTASGEILHQMTEVRPLFSQLIFSPTDPNLLASIDERGVVRLWNAREGTELFALTLLYDLVTTAAFSLDGPQLATGGRDRKVHIWDVSSGALLEVYPRQPANIVRLSFTPINAIIAFGNPEEYARVWNVQSSRIVSDFMGNE